MRFVMKTRPSATPWLDVDPISESFFPRKFIFRYAKPHIFLGYSGVTSLFSGVLGDLDPILASFYLQNRFWGGFDQLLFRFALNFSFLKFVHGRVMVILPLVWPFWGHQPEHTNMKILGFWGFYLVWKAKRGRRVRKLVCVRVS